MKLSKNCYILLNCLLFICFNLLNLSDVSAQIKVDLTSKQRVINSDFLGFNGRSTEGPSWSDVTFTKLLKQMRPGYVRYPGGTQANYWDWQSGTFIEGSGKTAEYNFSIPQFVSGLPTGTRIIYVVNMVRPTPSTGIPLNSPAEVLMNKSTLDKKITDMLNALDAFDKAGYLPEVVELGNELYFDNEHAGVYAANPTLYIEHIKTISQVLKQTYPELKILICTSKGGTKGRNIWNDTVLSSLKTDSELASLIHGIVQHHYINETYGSPDPVVDALAAKTAIAEGLLYVKDYAADYDLIPEGKKLWITEYGATKNNAPGTWSSALRTALMSLGWVELGENVENIMLHHITQDPDVINKQETKLGPVGMMFGILRSAIDGAESVQPLSFTPNPEALSQTGALYGFKFKGSESENLIILNIGNNAYDLQSLKGLFNLKNAFTIEQNWSATPWQSNVYEGNGVLSETTENIDNIKINPFSVTTIKAKTLSTGVNNTDEDSEINLFPQPATDFLNLSFKQELINGKLYIYDNCGKKRKEVKITDTNFRINISDLPAGIYILNIRTKGKSIVRKIIKTTFNQNAND